MSRARAIRHCLLLGLISVWCVGLPDRAAARSLEAALASTFPGDLRTDGEGLAQAFAATVAASFPITGTSTSFVYRLDPALGELRRRDLPLGPVFSERADTVGAGLLSLGVNYLVADYDAINGISLNALVSNDPRRSGDYLVIPNGDALEPVAALVQLDLEAQIVALSATYGVTQDLDANFFLPFVRTFLRASTTIFAPDPRVPPDPSYFTFTDEDRAVETHEGIGDILLRLKYRFLEHAWADVAAGGLLSLPTGSRADFQGTGDTLVGAALYVSRTWARRVEPHLNLGFVLDADTFDRSQVRYSAGADLRVFDWLTLNGDFLGRSDVAQPDTIERPVFVQIERADVLQASLGLKIAVPRSNLVGFFNALLPLNDDGVRADQLLAAGVEWIF